MKILRILGVLVLVVSLAAVFGGCGSGGGGGVPDYPDIAEVDTTDGSTLQVIDVNDLPADVIGRIESVNDYDVYEFTAATSGTKTFRLLGLSADLDLELYDASDVLIGESFNERNSNERITISVTQGSVYFLVVYPYYDPFDPWATGVSNYRLQIPQ